MTYKEDIEYSGNALEEAEKSIEYAVMILPLSRHASEVAQLKQALKVIRDVRKRLVTSKDKARTPAG